MSDPKTRVYTVLLIREAERPDRVVIWDTQDLTLGRSPENDLAIDHAEISRRHAIFEREGEAWTLKDLSTSNGTLVNGEAIRTHTLNNKDVVRVGELEIHFLHTTKNPATLGLQTEYASQLKGGLKAQAAPSNNEATMLGLMDSVGGDDDFEFQVAPPGDFDPRSMEAPLSKDLDAELQGTGLEFDMPSDTASRGAAAAGAAAGAGAAGSGRVSLQIEIAGLTPDLQRVLRAVEGKVIDLPSLQIRVKSDDLG